MSLGTLQVGPTVPAVRTPGGYFASRDRYDAAFSRVLLAVFTPVGTRPGRRSFGSRLATLMYLPQTPETAALCREVVSDAVTRWAPGVIVRDVLVTQEDERLRFDLTFSVESDPSAPVARTAYLQRSSLLQIVARPRA
jgi:phage baseplate assembly protein W